MTSNADPAPAGEPGAGVVAAARAVLDSASDTVAAWLSLAEAEARDAVARALVGAAVAAFAVVTAAAAWLFAVAAGVAWLVAGGMALAPALGLAALVNGALLAGALIALRALLRRPWFAATRRQLARPGNPPEPEDAVRLAH